MKLSKTSVALLLIQLALVSSIAAKYLYQRWNCPAAGRGPRPTIRRW